MKTVMFIRDAFHDLRLRSRKSKVFLLQVTTLKCHHQTNKCALSFLQTLRKTPVTVSLT